MKTINELRKAALTLNVREMASSVRYLKSNKIDFDVYLPTRKMNLQRDFVWNLDQKRELILTILLDRHIPHLAIMNIIDYQNNCEIFQIIDGKQRLSTIFDFIDDKFTIILEDKEYLFSELPKEYKLEITHANIRYYESLDDNGKVITDDEKIAWFKFLNFAGTPQDNEYIEKLNKIKS